MHARLEVINPADGTVAGHNTYAGPACIAALAGRARAAQPAWATWSAAQRAEVLRQARRILARDADRITGTLRAETGKTWEDAGIGELGYCLEALRYWSRRGPGMLADEWRRSWVTPAVLGRRTAVRRAPRGLVGVITPWNYPLALALADAAPALLAGNAVLLKPSEATPLTAELLADVFAQAGLPEGVLTVVQGDGAAGAAVVDEVDMVMLTGSTATGRRVAEQAARRLIPCSLELGGKDAMIVCADADLRRAARASAFYGLQNAGQICMSIERVYVEEPVHDAFVCQLVEQVQALRQGHGGAGEVEVGAMTTAAQLELVTGHVQDALARGAVAVTGGRRGPGPGRFFEPTVLTGVDHSMLCMTEETFGPIIPVMAVGGREEAIRLANDSPYGLAASVFTSDARAGETLARRLEVGSVVINDALIFFGAPYLPMGGWKQSGIGVRHGIEGLHKYTRPQSIVVGRDWPVRDPHWFPYRPSVSRTLRQVLRLSARR